MCVCVSVFLISAVRFPILFSDLVRRFPIWSEPFSSLFSDFLSTPCALSTGRGVSACREGRGECRVALRSLILVSFVSSKLTSLACSGAENCDGGRDPEGRIPALHVSVSSRACPGPKRRGAGRAAAEDSHGLPHQFQSRHSEKRLLPSSSLRTSEPSSKGKKTQC